MDKKKAALIGIPIGILAVVLLVVFFLRGGGEQAATPVEPETGGKAKRSKAGSPTDLAGMPPQGDQPPPPPGAGVPTAPSPPATTTPSTPPPTTPGPTPTAQAGSTPNAANRQAILPWRPDPMAPLRRPISTLTPWAGERVGNLPRLSYSSVFPAAITPPRVLEGKSATGEARDMRLSGIVMSGALYVILETGTLTTEPKGYVVKPGDEVDGIKVLKIERYREEGGMVTRALLRMPNSEQRYVYLRSGPPPQAGQGMEGMGGPGGMPGYPGMGMPGGYPGGGAVGGS